MMKTKLKILTMLTLSVAGKASATTIAFTPDTIAEFQTSGDNIYQAGSATATSTISDQGAGVLRVSTVISGSDQVIYTHDLVGMTIDPSLKEITTIDFSIEIRDPDVGNSDTPILLGIEQGGNTYFYTENDSSALQFRNAGSTSFLAFAKNGLTASNFGLIANTDYETVNIASNPDFSETGGSIQLVYGVMSATGSTTLTRNTDFRNSVLTVNHTAIPEPSATCMLGLAAGLLMFTPRRRFSKKAQKLD